MRFINESNCPMQEAVIQYHAPRRVNIGDVFYKIKAVDFQTFREPCLVCEDKKELTINGVTFRCPCCGRAEEVLRIQGYVVQRYRVFKITDEVGNSEWKADDHHRVKFSIYRKVGHGYQWAEHSESYFGDRDLERFLNVSEADRYSAHNVDQYLFDDYQLALKIAKGLTDAEIKKLDEYNAAHGSSCQPVFKTEHDKKSN